MSRLPKFPNEPNALLINEFFSSIQGESTQAGRPCFFIRLTGCHLRCGYCDTEYAFHEGSRYTLDQVLEKVREAGLPLVEVTGGEPLLQKAIYPLMWKLLAEGYEVMLETSGSLDAGDVPTGVRRIFDVKTPGSGEHERNRWENFGPAELRGRDEIKFVITSRDDYEWSKAVLRERLAHAIVPILFSPTWGKVSPADLADWITADRLPVRMQVQMHKVLWGEKRGV